MSRFETFGITIAYLQSRENDIEDWQARLKTQCDQNSAHRWLHRGRLVVLGPRSRRREFANRELPTPRRGPFDFGIELRGL